jgi:hypothetical protein
MPGLRADLAIWRFDVIDSNEIEDEPENPDAPAGWTTMTDGTHVVITRAEADVLLAKIEAYRKARAERMPDEKSAIHAMFDAFDRLRELGWQEAIYCPKDGSLFDAIEPGSTGIHPCYYEGKWPDGHWITGEGFDAGPGRPILFKLLPEDQAKYDAKMEAIRAKYRETDNLEPE